MAQHGTKGPTTERSNLTQIHKRCKALGTYKSEFDHAARRLARVYTNIDRVEAATAAEDFQFLVEHTNKNGSTNTVKNPLLNYLETLYDQALTLERELGLTSASLKRIKNDAGESQPADPLEKLLNSQ